MTDLSNVRALTFDVFGTVVDWRAGVAREVAAILPGVDAPAFADKWRAGYQPAMEAVRTGKRHWVPLDTLHREILVTLLAELGRGSAPESLVDELNLAWHRLDPWPEAAAGMARLRTKFILASLSNGNIRLMVDMTRHNGLRFDCILGAEISRAYKPSPVVYTDAGRILGIPAEQCMMVAAHPSDLDAAKACGLRTAYVHRPLEYGPGREQRRPDAGRFDLSVDNFGELANALGCP